MRKAMTHLVVIGKPEVYFIGYSYAIVIKKSPYTFAEMDNIKKYADGGNFESLIVPYKEYSEKYYPLAMGEVTLDKFIANSRNNVRPPTDDNPYFLEVVMNFRYNLMFLAISIALGIFIFWSFYYQRLLSKKLPLEDLNLRTSYLRFNLLVPYFTLSGIGSMLIEITLTKIFSYYLGYPQLNMVVILFCLFVGFGLGSLWSKKFQTNIFKKISLACLVLTGLLTIMIFTNNYFLRYTINFPIALRIFLVVIYLFPATFIMGIPFPTAIRTLSGDLSSEVPWMWGINGASAVLGSILSVVISMVFGITFAFAFGVFIYLVIAVIAYFLSKQKMS